MDVLRAYAWYRPYPGRFGMRDAYPPREAIKAMLAQLDRDMRRRRAQPVSLSCTRWPAGAFTDGAAEGGLGDRYLACIAIEIEPGGLERGLASWFEWQHPRWLISDAPPLLAHAPPILDLTPELQP